MAGQNQVNLVLEEHVIFTQQPCGVSALLLSECYL